MKTLSRSRRKVFFSLSLTLALALAVVGLAYADQVVNNIDTTIDPALETRTITSGGSTVVGFFIRALTETGDANGCNSTGADPATVNLNVPAGVTASRTSLEFTGCGITGDLENVTFSSSTVGSHTVSVASVTGGKPGSSWDTAPASFTLIVNPPADTTPPVITPDNSGTLGNNGWYTSDVTVSWTVVDNESAISSSSGCDPTTINTDTAGQTLTCTATSAGGTSSQSVTIKRDATVPSISGSASPAANGNGWNNTDVAVSFTCGDATSGVASCGPDQTLSGEGAGQSASGTAVDNAGNSASTTVSGINIDKTAPTASASASPAPNANSWNNSNVTVSFSGTDGLSGIDTCDADIVLSSEGAGQSASGSCTDLAGNVSAPATASGINIDKTAPTITWNGGPADGASYYFGFVPAAPTCTANDALSGPNDCSVTGYETTVGSQTMTATAYDVADNKKEETRSYTVMAWEKYGFYNPVDMNGTWNTVKGGSTVPLKFEVFAGATELTDTSIVSTLAKQVTCNAGPEDTIEVVATGGTSFRYDWISGQFIFNWQTPKLPSKCYVVTATMLDGGTIVANFKLK